MTTIVALHTPGKGTIVGSDTQLTIGGSRSFYPKGKFVVRDNWAIGLSGSYKTLTLIERHADELFKNIEQPHEIADRLVEMTKEYGYTHRSGEDGGPLEFFNTMIIANNEGVWDFDCTFAEIPVEPGQLAASGSGERYAIGSAHATQASKDPVKRVTAALAASMTYDVGSGGDMVLHFLKPMGKR